MRSLLVGIAIVIAGATATRAQTLPFYNIDELAKKCVETAAEAATKYSRLGDLSSFLADEAVCSPFKHGPAKSRRIGEELELTCLKYPAGVHRQSVGR